MNTEDIINSLTPDIYQRFKRAIETGKWPDGRVLSESQKQTCLQAVIVYEHSHVADHERTGYLPQHQCSSQSVDEPESITWKHE